MPVTIGVISDTHGRLREEALAALRGSDLIVHAGDVGRADILDRLRAIAPVSAVRGNVDIESWAGALPLTDVVAAGGVHLYVVHRLEDLDLDPAAAGFAAVIYGHTHQPAVEVKSGVLYLNPGSAGPKRFHLPVCLARLRIEGDAIEHEFVPVGD